MPPTPSDQATAPSSFLPPGYSRLHGSFRWQVPAQFNIAQVCSQRWAEQGDEDSRIAIRSYAGGAPQSGQASQQPGYAPPR